MPYAVSHLRRAPGAEGRGAHVPDGGPGRHGHAGLPGARQPQPGPALAPRRSPAAPALPPTAELPQRFPGPLRRHGEGPLSSSPSPRSAAGGFLVERMAMCNGARTGRTQKHDTELVGANKVQKRFHPNSVVQQGKGHKTGYQIIRRQKPAGIRQESESGIIILSDIKSGK